MSERRNRRGFLQQIVGDIASGVRQATGARVATSSQPVPGESLEPQEPPPEPRPRAPGAKRTPSVTWLREQAAVHGLAARADAIVELARFSARLTVCDETGEPADRGGQPAAVATAWAFRQDRPGPTVAEIDLTRLDVRLRLPSAGLLRVRADEPAEFADVRPEERIGVELVPAPPQAAPDGRALALSLELQLPRVWAAPVQHLVLGDDETEAWEALRLALARRHGFEPEDTVPGVRTLHRLLGYPDERRGMMPLHCECVAQGIDLTDGIPYGHPRLAEIEAMARRWRLLLQLSADDALAWDFGAGRDRLYLWIDGARLATGDISGVHAIAQ